MCCLPDFVLTPHSSPLTENGCLEESYLTLLVWQDNNMIFFVWKKSIFNFIYVTISLETLVWENILEESY